MREEETGPHHTSICGRPCSGHRTQRSSSRPARSGQCAGGSSHWSAWGRRHSDPGGCSRCGTHRRFCVSAGDRCRSAHVAAERREECRGLTLTEKKEHGVHRYSKHILVSVVLKSAFVWYSNKNTQANQQTKKHIWIKRSESWANAAGAQVRDRSPLAGSPERGHLMSQDWNTGWLQETSLMMWLLKEVYRSVYRAILPHKLTGWRWTVWMGNFIINKQMSVYHQTVLYLNKIGVEGHEIISVYLISLTPLWDAVFQHNEPSKAGTRTTTRTAKACLR